MADEQEVSLQTSESDQSQGSSSEQVSLEVAPELAEAFPELNEMTPEERESPRVKGMLKNYMAKTREMAEIRKQAERAASVEEQYAMLTDAIKKDPDAVVRLFSPAKAQESQPAVTEQAPDNVYLQDPDMRAAVEYLAKQMLSTQQREIAAYKQRVDNLVTTQVTGTVSSQAAAFLKEHPEIDIPAKQLTDAAMQIGPALNLRPDDPQLMAYAVVRVLGGVDPIAAKAAAAKSKTFIEQTKKNAAETGTAVKSGSPAVSAPEVPDNLKDPSFRSRLVGLLEAKGAARK